MRAGSRSSRLFLRPFCGNPTARCRASSDTSRPSAHPHQPLREWRGIDCFAQNISDAGGESPPWIQLPWLDRHDFYRSGRHASARGLISRARSHFLCRCIRLVGPFRKSGLSSAQKLNNHPERQGRSRMRTNEIKITRNRSVISNTSTGSFAHTFNCQSLRPHVALDSGLLALRANYPRGHHSQA